MMSRPTNKSELVQLSNELFQNLMDFIFNLSEKARYQTFKTRERDKNIRDILYHLHAWHEMLLKWFLIDEEGGTPILPSPGYTWDDLDALNQTFWEDAQAFTLDHVISLIDVSHQKVILKIESLDDQALHGEGYFKWAGKAPIFRLIDAIMAHHYEWGLTTLKKLFNT